MKRTGLSRREFVSLAVAGCVAPRVLGAQTFGAHASVAEMEREHILASAKSALAKAPEERTGDDSKFLRNFSQNFAALTAAFVLTKDATYAETAGRWLIKFCEAEAFNAFYNPPRSEEDLGKLLPLAEVARALAFFNDNADADALHARDEIVIFLGHLLEMLSSNWIATLARDRKDHRASAWLLLVASCARTTRSEEQLDALRLRFKKRFLRNQIAADGRFPQEVASDNPYRNSLFNFDLLAGACQLLTSPYDDLWNFELPDGPGMRSVAAYLFPAMRDRAKWGFPADATHFRDLPGRRPGLLFAGRAYDRPEYVELFRSLPTAPPPEDLAYTFPITQPLLWTARAPHGL